MGGSPSAVLRPDPPANLPGSEKAELREQLGSCPVLTRHVPADWQRPVGAHDWVAGSIVSGRNSAIPVGCRILGRERGSLQRHGEGRAVQKSLGGKSHSCHRALLPP